jgi:hypothetical protein
MKPDPAIPTLNVPTSALDRIIDSLFCTVERIEDRLRRKPASASLCTAVEYEDKTA